MKYAGSKYCTKPDVEPPSKYPGVHFTNRNFRCESGQHFDLQTYSSSMTVGYLGLVNAPNAQNYLRNQYNGEAQTNDGDKSGLGPLLGIFPCL